MDELQGSGEIEVLHYRHTTRPEYDGEIATCGSDPMTWYRRVRGKRVMCTPLKCNCTSEHTCSRNSCYVAYLFVGRVRVWDRYLTSR